jgi:hypothetical protein
VTDSQGTDPLVSGLRKAALHFSKAAVEVASGVSDLVQGIVHTVRPDGGNDGSSADGPQRIDIE